ncbi:hypothetical protein Tco_0007363 [Tanacetum coccineum]
MTPLAAQLKRKPKRDRGTRRGRQSTSSSSAFDQPSSSYLNDDDDDGNDEGTSRASTPSPIRYVNSLTNQVPQFFQNPPNINSHLEPFYTCQTEIINRQVQLRDEYRGGLRSIGKSLRKLWRNMKKELVNIVKSRVEYSGSGVDFAPLPPRNQGHLWLRYQVVGYTEEIVQILSRGLRRYSGGRDDGQEGLFERRSLLYINQRPAAEVVPQVDLIQHFWEGQARVKYLFRHAEGRKSDARLSRGHFIGRLAHNFSLVSDDRLRGLSIVTRELLLIDMGELVKLNICIEIGDDWAWVAPGPKRHPDAADDALGAAEDAPAVDEGVEADPAPIQAPQPSPPPAARTMTQRLGRLKEEMQGLRHDVRSLRRLVERSMTKCEVKGAGRKKSNLKTS